VRCNIVNVGEDAFDAPHKVSALGWSVCILYLQGLGYKRTRGRVPNVIERWVPIRRSSNLRVCGKSLRQLVELGLDFLTNLDAGEGG
jgi:hypothetical protein